MDNTIIQQGRFTSDGTTETIAIRSDLDWMIVTNVTVAAANQTTAVGVEYKWLRGFPAGAQLEYLKSNAAAAANLVQYATSGGFTLIDSSLNPNGLLNNGSTGISNVSAANPPVVTVGSTAGMAPGNVVRIYNVVGAQQLGGVDFTIGYGTFSGTTFSLDYMAQIAAAAAPGALAAFRVIKFNPIFYPRRRTITKITKAAQAVVTLSVTHQFTVGQQVRAVVPSQFGMTQMNGLLGTVVAIDTSTSVNSITLDIDSSAFDTFAWPTTLQGPFQAAEIVPVGQNTGYSLSQDVDILADATINQAFIGISLAAGANSPAGQDNDVIYWVAGKSFSVDNN